MPLPDGLKFLHGGWWLIHLLAILLIYLYAYRKGRADQRREQRGRDAAPGGKLPP